MATTVEWLQHAEWDAVLYAPGDVGTVDDLDVTRLVASGYVKVAPPPLAEVTYPDPLPQYLLDTDLYDPLSPGYAPLQDRLQDLVLAGLADDFVRRDSPLVRDVTAYDGVVADLDNDDSDGFQAMLNGLPDYDEGWGPNNNFDVSGVRLLTVPDTAKVRLTRPMDLPDNKAVHLLSPKGGGRIYYEGAAVRSDGAMVAGSKTLSGSLFTDAHVGSEVAVRGAGEGGSTLVTWVQSRTDAGHVQTAHAAQTTVGPAATYVLDFAVFRRKNLRSDPRGVPYTFQGLVIHGGSLCFSNGTKPVAVYGVTFHKTQGPALTALNKANAIGGDPDVGTASVTYTVRDVLANHCWGTYWHLAKTAGLSKLDNLRSMGSRDIPMVLLSGFHEIDHPDFQGAVDGTRASMWFPSSLDVGGRTLLTDPRFGSEAFTEDGVHCMPPVCSIHVGPLSGPVVTDSTTRPQEIHISGKAWFGGGNAVEGHSDTSAKHAIILNKRVRGLQLHSGFLGDHHRQHISEAWLDAGPGGTSGTTLDAIDPTNWLDPSVTISDTHRGGLFTHGGADWRPLYPPQRLAVPPVTRKRANYLQRSGRFDNAAAWARSLVSAPVGNLVGPDGEANTGYTMTRTAVGTAGVEQTMVAATVVDFVPGEPCTFHVAAMALTHNIMTLAVMATVGANTRHLAPNLRPIVLSGRWERYAVHCPYVPAGTTQLLLGIYHDVPSTLGAPTDPALVGTSIAIGLAQLEPGLDAGPYIDVPQSVNRRALPSQSLIIGRNVITWGAAAPDATMGRREVGDEHRNTVPAILGVAGSRYVLNGWVCTTGGVVGSGAVWSEQRTLTGT